MTKNGGGNRPGPRKLPATPHVDRKVHVNQQHNPRRLDAHHACVDFRALAGDHSVELVNHAHAPVHHPNAMRPLGFRSSAAALRRIQHGRQNDAGLGAEPDVTAIAEDFVALGEGWIGVWVTDCENRTEETAELVVGEGRVAGHCGKEPESVN